MEKVAHYVQKTVQAHFQPMVSDYKLCIQIPLVLMHKWELSSVWVYTEYFVAEITSFLSSTKTDFQTPANTKHSISQR